MPRPRKYDYKVNYPITIHIRIPIWLFNSLEDLGYTKGQIAKEVEKSKIVERFLVEIVENNSKKD